MGELQNWLDEDWVRIGADGTILGSCGSRKEAEGKPKCLPRKKAEGMSKEARAKLVARKRKKDPNPDRKGKPIMVSNNKWKKRKTSLRIYHPSLSKGKLIRRESLTICLGQLLGVW